MTVFLGPPSSDIEKQIRPYPETGFCYHVSMSILEETSPDDQAQSILYGVCGAELRNNRQQTEEERKLWNLYRSRLRWTLRTNDHRRQGLKFDEFTQIIEARLLEKERKLAQWSWSAEDHDAEELRKVHGMSLRQTVHYAAMVSRVIEERNLVPLLAYGMAYQNCIRDLYPPETLIRPQDGSIKGWGKIKGYCKIKVPSHDNWLAFKVEHIETGQMIEILSGSRYLILVKPLRLPPMPVVLSQQQH